MSSLCLVFVTALVAQPIVDRSPGTVAVQADSLVVQGRRVRARRRAIDRALRKAVGQEAVRVSRSSVASAAASRLVLSRFRRFVVSYRMLREWFDGHGPSGSYHVSLEVRVDDFALARVLGGRNRLAGGPCIIAKGSVDVVSAMSGILRTHGFQVPCLNGGAMVTVSCVVVRSGVVGASHGATVRCDTVMAFGSSNKHRSVSKSGLGGTPAQARKRAEALAGVAIGKKVLELLGESASCRRCCRRQWNVVVDGPTGFLSQYVVVQNLIHRFSAHSVTSMQFSRGRVFVRLFLDRCERNLASALAGMQVFGAVLSAHKDRPGWLSIRLEPKETGDD